MIDKGCALNGTVLVMVTTMICCTAACGMGEPPAPLVIEAPPADRPAPIELPARPGFAGFFAGDHWPDACALLTDDEITTVIPQATINSRQSHDQNLQLLGLGVSGRSIVAEDTTCNIELEIPEAGLSGPRSPSMFLSIDAAGSTEVAEANLLLDNYSEPIETSSGACFGEGLQVQCMDGVVTFTLRIDLLFQQRSDDTWTDRFQIDGEVTTITGSTPDDMREWFQFIQVNLLARLVEPIVRKL